MPKSYELGESSNDPFVEVFEVDMTSYELDLISLTVTIAEDAEELYGDLENRYPQYIGDAVREAIKIPIKDDDGNYPQSSSLTLRHPNHAPFRVVFTPRGLHEGFVWGSVGVVDPIPKHINAIANLYSKTGTILDLTMLGLAGDHITPSGYKSVARLEEDEGIVNIRIATVPASINGMIDDYDKILDVLVQPGDLTDY